MSMGHNGGPDFASFDEVVRENLQRGLLLTVKETFIQLMRDERLEHRHRRVFVEIVAAMNDKSGAAYPGYKRLAEQSGYSEGGIRKTLSELMTLGYLVSVRRQPSVGGGKALAHYTIRKPTIAEIESEINKFVLMTRNLKPRQKPRFWEKPDVHPGGNVTAQSNISNLMLPPSVTSSNPVVTPVATTVTSNTSYNNQESLLSLTDSLKAHSPETGVKLSAQAQIAIDEYNEAASKFGFSKCRLPLEKTRAAKLNRLIKAHGLETWREALRLASSSDFCRGRVAGSTFLLHLGFLLQAESFARLLDGAYNNRRPASPQQQGIGRG